jgi:hypothetical protein
MKEDNTNIKVQINEFLFQLLPEESTLGELERISCDVFRDVMVIKSKYEPKPQDEIGDTDER